MWVETSGCALPQLWTQRGLPQWLHNLGRSLRWPCLGPSQCRFHILQTPACISTVTPSEKLPTNLERCISQAHSPAFQRFVFCVSPRVDITYSWSYTHNSTPTPFPSLPMRLSLLTPWKFSPCLDSDHALALAWEKPVNFSAIRWTEITPSPVRSEPLPWERASLQTLSFLEYFHIPREPFRVLFTSLY